MFTQKEIKMLWDCVFAEKQNAEKGYKKLAHDERCRTAIKAYADDLTELLLKVNHYMTDEEE